jgi:IPT/TIG domain
MKWLLRSVPLFAVMLVACTTTNNPVVDTNAPTITRFTPDTVWTGGTLTIYGTHFGFGNDVSVAIDTTQVRVSSTYDTVMTVNIPETAQTGLIHVGTINGRTTSTKPVVVENTFSPGTINDTLPIGASFSIPGTGMNHSHGLLLLTVAGIRYPIDSVFANRIVSHVVPYGLSGSVIISDSDRTYNGWGTLTVTRPSSWNTLSIIWDHVTVTETHTRFGYVNGPANPVDSTWKDTVMYLGQHDVNVSGVPFTRVSGALQYALAVPSLQITWDTGSQTATVFYEPTSSFNTTTLTLDTTWDIYAYNLGAMLPVTNAIEFVMPNFYYQITEDSTDTQGLVNWQETTTATLNSGSFDLILKP